MNKAPLQIYSSALILAPEKSTVRELFDASIPQWLATRPIMQSNWDPCLATFESQCHEFGTPIVSFPTTDRFLFLSGMKMEIWDMRTISCIAVYDDVLSTSVSFSSDGRELFYLSGNKNLQVMSTVTRSCIAEFRGHTDKITRAIFSTDGQQLASSSRDGSLRIWDRTTRKCTATYQFNHDDRMVGFSPDGKSFLINSDGGLYVLNSKTIHRKLMFSKRVRQVAFSKDGVKLISTESKHKIRFTDISSGISLIAEGADTYTNIPFIFFSGGDQLICPTRYDEGSGSRNIGIWNTLTATCNTLLEGHRANISDIVLSNDEKRIASASFDRSIRVWDAQNGSCIAIYNGHDEQISNIAYSADGKLLISLDKQGISKVWDTNSELQSAKVDSHGSAVLEVVFSPDKKRVLTTAGERTIKLWDTLTGECIMTGEDHVLFAKVPLVVPHDILSAPYDSVITRHDLYGWPRSVEFCSDSSKFISSTGMWSSSIVKLWDTNTGDCELLYRSARDAAISIAITPNGTTVSSTFREGTVMYWDTTTKNLLGSFGGETHDLSSSTFSLDGTYLMLGYEDGTIRLYHLSTRKWREMSEAHERPVELMTMSADGTRLASYCPLEIKLWETDTCTCIANPVSALGAEATSQIIFSPNTRYLIALYVTGKVKIEIFCASTGNTVAQLEICGLANHIEFDSAGSSLLITNVGTFTFDPPTFQAVNTIGLGLSNDGEWITWNSRNLLWLPPTFRISASDIDVAASLIALGSRLGRLLLIGIDSSKLPGLLSR